jgi:hypothetical protein
MASWYRLCRKPTQAVNEALLIGRMEVKISLETRSRGVAEGSRLETANHSA